MIVYLIGCLVGLLSALALVYHQYLECKHNPAASHFDFQLADLLMIVMITAASWIIPIVMFMSLLPILMDGTFTNSTIFSIKTRGQ